MNADDRFFHLQDLFNLTAKDWLDLFNEIECLSTDERYAALYGHDDTPYIGYE